MITVKALSAVCALMFLAVSCARSGNQAREEAEGAAAKLQLGMTPDEVRALLGEPDYEFAAIRRHSSGYDAVWHYWSMELEHSGWWDVSTDQAYLEISFEDGRVDGWEIHPGIPEYRV